MKATVRGLEKLEHRLTKQLSCQPHISQALQSMSPTRLDKKPWGVSSHQHALRYRLTLGALNVPDLQGHPMTCPYAFCETDDQFCAEHVMWTCTAAQRFWQTLLARWTGPTSQLDPAAIIQNVFAPSAPPLAPSTRNELLGHDDRVWHLHKSVQAVWMVISYAATQQLWLTRNAATFNNQTVTLCEHTATMLATVRNQLAALATACKFKTTDVPRAPVIEALLSRLASSPLDEPEYARDVRLYFDGGSRGNPGVTGTGCVLLEHDRDSTWTIVWHDAHYLGDKETNNVAEHTALLRGLAEAVRRYEGSTHHVTIIGDSQLVLAQMRGEARATQHGIKALLMRSTALLRRLPAYDLQHTLRNGNKMADRLANWAMDTHGSSSLTPADHELMTDLTDAISNDVESPWTRTAHPNRLLPKFERSSWPSTRATPPTNVEGTGYVS